jgi:hypothetical protein
MAYNPSAGNNVWRTTFASVIANSVDSTYWDLIRTGTGQTVNQTGGNLVLTSGTTANAETIIRSKQSFQTFYLNLRYQASLSQRIVNNNFVVELVDVIGDGLAYTINSSTSVTVTIPTNPFTSANVGQSMYLGAITGAAGVPMRAAIASVSGTAVTFTVAGWPATGTGTLSLFGWNYQQLIYTGTTVTNVSYDAQRKGWASGATAANVNTTASPGHIVQLYQDDNVSVLSEGLAASTVGTSLTQRAIRWMNIPTNEFPLYVQIRSLNGVGSPVSTTTFTVGFVAVEELTPNPVQIEAGTQSGPAAGVAVTVMNAPTVTGTVAISGYPTAAASADALANPTVTQIGAADLVFNGATWDRRRGNLNLTIGDTGAKTVTFNGATATNFNGAGGLITCVVSAVSGTTPTMALQLQWSPDGGTTWLNYGPPTAALTAAGTATIGCFPTQWEDATSATLAAHTVGSTVSKFINAPLPRTFRVVYTIGGTTPSFTLTNTYFNSITA